LKGLTAAGLALEQISTMLGPTESAGLRRVQKLLADEQQAIRAFITQSRPRPFETRIGLEELSRQLAEETARFLPCETRIVVEPPNATIDAALGRELCMLIGEAMSNAVRHGRATQVQIALDRAATYLRVGIVD